MKSRTAVVSALAVLGSLLSPLAPAFAAPSGDGKDKIWTPPNTPLQRTASVPGKADKPQAAPLPTGSPNWVPPKTAPQPKHGKAVVALDAAPAASRNAAASDGRKSASGASRQAGDLPVWLAPIAGAAPAASVQVQVADPKTAAAAGAPGALISLSRGDGAEEPGKVQVGLDLGSIGFGGDFAHRARLTVLPECALTTPDADGCRTGTPVAAHYDEQAKRLVADVELAAASAASAQQRSEAASAGTAAAAPQLLLALDGAPQSGTGTYSATSLSPSQAWAAGSSSGSFTYSYPIVVPPALGGTPPSVSLGYDSSAVDGKTASTNAQASWIGDGWDLGGGFVERGYRGCDKAGIPGSGDQCWGGPNLTLSLGGHSGELVPDDASCVSGNATDELSKCTWRLRRDDGTKVEFLTGADNGTWNGSYLKVTDTTSGTVFYFGLNQLPTANGTPAKVGPESKSAWSVPVYSPNPGDPCYEAAKGKGSWCQTAWRWNLDYVVDSHGNLTTYSYTPELNRYARGGAQNGGKGELTPYTRGGVLATIGYGQLLSDQLGANGAFQPAAKIDFTAGERCKSGAICDPAQRTTANAANWPDVPMDKQCLETGACANYTPTYWSTLWLNSITTSIRSGGTYRPVDQYDFVHEFKTPQNATDNAPIAWLQSVKRTGKDTANGQSEQALPEVTFTDELLPNRVDGLVPARPRYNRPRLAVISTETGGTILVSYAKESCSRTAGRMPTSADSNDKSCFPVKWFDTGVQTTVDDWFLRYPVETVTVDPNAKLITGAVSMTTSYTYGPAAWHRSDGALVESDYRTWDQFRGYASVTTVTGSGKDGAQAKSTTSYYQGMNGDIKANGSAKAASVAGVKSGSKPDEEWLSGQVLEKDTYADAAAPVGAPVAYTVNSYERSAGLKPTATHKRTGLPDLVANYLATTSTSVTTSVTTTGTRSTSTVTTTDPGNNNRITISLSTADGTPDVCTRYRYVSSPGQVVTGRVSEVYVISGPNACTADASSANTVSGARTLYDGQGFGTSDAKGDVTETQVLDRYDANGAAQYVTKATAAFDGYGRVTSATDPTVSDAANPDGAVVTTAYSSANPGELPNKMVTGTPAPVGAPDAGKPRATTVTLNPARALPITSEDPNGRKTIESYDGLGRLKAVWIPGRDTAAGANFTYDYTVNAAKSPSTVTTTSLRSGGNSHSTSTQILDGLGRVVQTQDDPAVSAYHGRLITDTFYDSQGRVNRKYNTYYEDTTAPNTIRWIPEGAKVPNLSVIELDGLGRPVSMQFVALGKLQTTTTTAYPGADRVDVSPPTGATATSAVTDARGRTIELWQYRKPTATGTPADADVSRYTYTPAGQTASRVDAAGNTWSYAHDQRGRQVKADDPETGISTVTYDTAGRVAATTDARGQVISYTYDLLGRKTGTYNGSVAAINQLTAYTYDTVAKGQPAGSTRYVGGASGAAYSKNITELDTAYRPTKTNLSIPGEEIGKTGQTTFDYSAAYDPITGAIVADGRAAAGDLAQESVNYNYETYGKLNDISGAGITYLRQADWDAYGRNIRATMNPWGSQIVATNTYDEPTGRLLTQYVDKQTGGTGTVQNTTYAYDPAGQITAIRTIPNNNPAATDLQCFTHDYLGRITSAWSDTGRLEQPTPSLAGQGACANTTPTSGAVAPAKTTVGGSAPYWQDYTYDAVGNRTKLVMHNPTGDISKDLTIDQVFPTPGTRNTPTTAAGTGGGTGGPHAPTTVKSTFPNNGSAPGANQYDAAGNTTKIANPGGNKTLGAGFVLKAGESVRSNSTQLTMQDDGNLVLTSLRTGLVTWSTNTQNHPGAWATMQDDGNFVVYDPQRVPLWSSQTWIGAGSKYFAVVQDDGKFIVYAPGWVSKWGTPTWNAVDAANGTELVWDVEGKLASMKQGTATTGYLYDADGNQLIRRNPGKVTVNLGGGDELVYDTGSKTSTGTRYYTMPGGITLVRQGPTKLTYQFSDHHNTGTLSIDSAGSTETRRWTDPFGVVRGSGAANSWAGDKGFVGGLKDDNTGFTNLGARQYQPSTGRFLSPDPLILPGDPQQWNAYAYSNNNPVDKSDPTGMALEECASGFATCSNMGTKVINDKGPNHDTIVAEIQAGEPARKAGYVAFMIAKKLPLGNGWSGSVPDDLQAEKRAARRAYGLQLEAEYKKNTNFKYETVPGQTVIPGAQPYDSIVLGKAKRSELMACAYTAAVLDCLDEKRISSWAAEFAVAEYPEDVKAYKGSDPPRVNAFRHFAWQAMITAKYGRQNAEMLADAHEAYGAREGHEYHDHISDLVNNEYGWKVGEKIGAANPGASDAQLKALILGEARKYVASDDFARPSDFE
ncbi:RHS repeat-associated core domain-containing protein [Kitasatospora sp. NPDC005856]|uniref:RHS repeat domain-containing protein n=1 Tax=Kitasatospora sp. NPDC005856 TaxID=3154566 RepID=UPI0033C90A87